MSFYKKETKANGKIVVRDDFSETEWDLSPAQWARLENRPFVDQLEILVKILSENRGNPNPRFKE